MARNSPICGSAATVALIGLSSGVPMPLFVASGYLGAAQLDAAEILLAETARQGLVRVVMLHHPPQATASSLGRGLRTRAVLRR